jgi:hypothetical protein
VFGHGQVTFTVDRLLLGQGAYVASVGIFRSLRVDGHEDFSYHVLDRIIHFQIIQPLDDVQDRGLCRQPYSVQLSHDD